jgi:hypothetical protein
MLLHKKKVGKAVVYLFAFISIFLLLPLLWFMKLGISKKGKVIIISSSFFISLLALLTQITYPIWQSILICLLLIAITTYFLNKRFANIIFEMNVHHYELDKVSLHFDFEEESADGLNEWEKDEEKLLIENILEEVLDEKQDLTIKDDLEENIVEEVIDEADTIDVSLVEKLIEKELTEQLEPVESIEISELDMDELILEEIEVPKKEIKNEETPLVEFFNEIKELSPDLFSEINVEEEAKIEYDDDEIIPIKEFALSPKDETESKPRKEGPVDRKNYLSEIEKLLEES